MMKGSSECPVQLGSTVDLALYLGLPTIQFFDHLQVLQKWNFFFAHFKVIKNWMVGRPRNKATLDLRGTSDCELYSYSI